MPAGMGRPARPAAPAPVRAAAAAPVARVAATGTARGATAAAMEPNVWRNARAAKAARMAVAFPAPIAAIARASVSRERPMPPVAAVSPATSAQGRRRARIDCAFAARPALAKFVDRMAVAANAEPAVRLTPLAPAMARPAPAILKRVTASAVQLMPSAARRLAPAARPSRWLRPVMARVATSLTIAGFMSTVGRAPAHQPVPNVTSAMKQEPVSPISISAGTLVARRAKSARRMAPARVKRARVPIVRPVRAADSVRPARTR